MIVTDLPSLPPAVYGRANALRTELLEAARYAKAHPSSADAIVALLDGVSELIQPTEPAPEE